MARRLLVASALVLAVGIGLAWHRLGPRDAPPAPVPPAKPSPYRNSFSARNWTYYLRPLPAPTPGPRPDAATVWRDLFPGMVADQETRALLRRLYGGLSVEAMALESEAADDGALVAPPSEGFAIALRLANLGAEVKKTPDGETLFGLMALGRATSIAGAAPAAESLGGFADQLRAQPADRAAFALSAEDYLLRHQTGWLLVGGPIFDDKQKLPANATEQRADLDRRIQAHADQAAVYYGKLLGKH